MDTKKLGIYKWECEDQKCGWEGDYPDILNSFEYLGISEDEVEEDYEIEYIEICPECGKQVVYSNLYALRLLFKK